MPARTFARVCSIAACAALLAFACNTPKTRDFDREALLSEVGHDEILPGYERVASEAKSLREAASALCDAANVSTLTAARDAYRATLLAWQRTAAYRFGPASDDNFGPELAFSPVSPSAIEAQAAGSGALTADAIDALGGAKKGLYALEYLLFAGDDALSALKGAHRCQYAAALASHVQRTSEKLADAWRSGGGGFVDTLTTAGKPGNARYPAELSAVSAVITQLLTALENVKDAKLGTPLGLTATSAEPDPSALESPYAHLSLEAMQANLQGVEAVWKGSQHNFDAYLRTRNAALADKVLGQLAAVDDALAALPTPFSDYVAGEDHHTGQAAYDALKELTHTIAADVDAALAVSLMFNENDGD